jgi:hypothetical protein
MVRREYHHPIVNMASPPSSSVRELVKHKFDDDRYLPYIGEIIVVRLSEDLAGPGSALTSCRLVPLATISTTRLY